MPDDIVDWDPGADLSVAERLAEMALTRRRCPVAWASRHGGQWDVLRYDDIVAITSDPDSFSNASQTRYGDALPPLEYDPPQHRDIRRLLAVFFTPKKLALIEERLRQAARRFLAPLIAAGGGDFAKNFSYPLPVVGLCFLLDIDQRHVDEIKDWSENTFLMDSQDEGHRELAMASHERIIAFAHTLIADRRQNSRPPEDDITAAFLCATPNGQPLADDIVARALRLLISAGHNSTTSAIGNAILHLAEHPRLQEQLRRDRTLIPAAVEELLRLDTPVQEMPRFAKKAVCLAGRKIQAGDRLGMFWASGNLDEDAFPAAGDFDLNRRPNRHLTFGHGIHTCLGAPMARLEIRIALEELFDACSSFRLAGDPQRATFHRMGVTHLPLDTRS